MNVITDYIVLFSFLYFFYAGWRKGLFRTLMGPISLIVGSIAGLGYYHKTHDFLISLLTSIIVPLIIQIIISLLLKGKTKTADKEDMSFSLSRLLAGFLSLFWSGSLLFLTLLLIAIVPTPSQGFHKVQDAITNSRIYSAVNQLFNDKLPTQNRNLTKLTSILEDPSHLEEVRNTPQYRELMADQRMAELFSDQTTIEQIQNKDILKLMQNPKVLAILNDEKLISKLMSLQNEILKGTSGTKSDAQNITGSNKTESQNED